MSTLVRRTQKAWLAALETEIQELHAWKAQVAKRNPDFLVDMTSQPEAGQREVPALHEGTIVKKKDKPAP